MKLRIAYQKLLHGIELIAVFIVTAVVGCLLFNETFGLVSDYLGYPIAWISEVSVFLFAWLVFLGAAILARHGGHIALDIVTFHIPIKYAFYFRLLTVITGLIVSIVMVYYGFKLAIFAGKGQKTLYLGVSFFYYYLSVPISGMLMGLNYIGWLLYKPPIDKEAARVERISENPLY
jgi:TRAP-type C4-dicarboxylate transport system permease small subunit